MAQIKNLKKAAQRIKKAIDNQENIVLYGDTDTDGATSVVILEETIKTLGFKVKEIYFPDREKEGYGLNEKGIKNLKKFSPGLLILLDCGISSFKEIETARKTGFEVIVLDHHNILKQGLPKSASIIVDPKQKGDDYPFKFLSAAGLTFKLAQEILKEKLTPTLRSSFLELTALATLADKMPKSQENLFFIEQGLSSLKNTFRPGLKLLRKEFSHQEFLEESLAQKMILFLQLSDVNENHKSEAYILLTASNEKEAKKTLKTLREKYEQRKKLLNDLTEQLLREHKEKNELFVFDGGEDIPYILAGALASRLNSILKKPIFIFHDLGKEIRASVRVPQRINSLEALEHCSQFLKTYGGHPPASGFSAPKKNLEKIKNCLKDYFQKNYDKNLH